NIDIKLISVEDKKDISLIYNKINSRTYLLKPSLDLKNYNSYRIIVTKSTKDYSGNFLKKQYENKFIIINKTK
ncbi:MAG: hypothetical protein U9N34_01910, partial [Candidatus Cloacimonadota bacterium]|nr:hypothetical protein [Candidatus Cloacimonadota bacterium]